MISFEGGSLESELARKIQKVTEEELSERGLDLVVSDLIRKDLGHMLYKKRIKAGFTNIDKLAIKLHCLGSKELGGSQIGRYERGEIRAKIPELLFLGLGWIYKAWGSADYEEFRVALNYGTDREYWPQCVATMRKARSMNDWAYLEAGKRCFKAILIHRKV